MYVVLDRGERERAVSKEWKRMVDAGLVLTLFALLIHQPKVHFINGKHLLRLRM